MNDSPKAPARTYAAGAFDAAAWRQKLLALNPWARGHSIHEKDELDEIFPLRSRSPFAEARQAATLERLKKDPWNEWAKNMLALRKDLEGAAIWAPERNLWKANLSGKNEETRHWLAMAAVVFSGKERSNTFEDNFRGLIFPWDAFFAYATFSGITDFEGAIFRARAQFARAVFVSDVYFLKVAFGGDALFSDVSFGAATEFQDAIFAEDAYFGESNFASFVNCRRATFTGSANFDKTGIAGASFEDARFISPAGFHSVTFTRDASFKAAHFDAVASFAGSTFEGAALMSQVLFNDHVDFSQVTFRKEALFERSIFRNSANFEAIGSEAAFSLANARFHHVPTFFGATFKGVPRLDNVATPKNRLLGWTIDENASARFRELKRRAIEAQDRDRELEFFAQETRTARFHSNLPILPVWEKTYRKGQLQLQIVWMRLPAWVPRFWSWRFWFGLAYGTLSNFGRSFLRPLLFWLALLVGFAVFYLGQHEGQHHARNKPDSKLARIAAYVTTARTAWANPPDCVAANTPLVAKTDAVKEALFLSASNALVVFNVGRGDVSRRTYGCLYGFEPGGQQAPPIMPYRVAVASTIQTLLSAILIFLFLLAVRNLLRLK